MRSRPPPQFLSLSTSLLAPIHGIIARSLVPTCSIGCAAAASMAALPPFLGFVAKEADFETGVSVEAGDEDQLDENLSVQGLDNAG